jgi:ornithine decarboxylase
MNRMRARSAVSPLHVRFVGTPQVLPTISDLVATERLAEPMYCLRPAAVTVATQAFVEAFPGQVMHAVKCNPEPVILRAVRAGGVRKCDCASIAKVRLVRPMFDDASIHFMDPVKARSAIREAWAQHAVNDFVPDTRDELAKILGETASTGIAGELGLIIRPALPKGNAVLDLLGKFGASIDDAVALVRSAPPHATRLGLSFHVGSQCLDPLAWRNAFVLAGEAIRAAGVAIDVLDVGGGFPISYPDVDPPPLGAFIAEVEIGVERLGPPGARLWAEPGRALMAGGASVVVQVQQRRGDTLCINDGVYGCLADSGTLGFRYPVRLIRLGGVVPSDALVALSMFGPTCDGADRMRGPFLVPADVTEGDWIEICQLGSYGACLRTAFNGFDRARLFEVGDMPLLATPRAAAATTLQAA